MSPSNATPKAGNPAVVGLAGFGLTTLLLQFHNLSPTTVNIGPVIWAGMFFGGLAQFIAGLQEQKGGNNFGYCAFTGYGSFWLSLVGMLIGNKLDFFKVEPSDIGFFMSAWTLFTAILWVASAKIHAAMFVTFTTLLAGFILLDLKFFGVGDEFGFYAGIDLTVCALSAFYMMAHVIYMDVFGRDVLPVGKPILN